ncbi:MAG TPA: hypothetical protein VGI70_04950, partial [Polyangiales bacterium]
APKPTTPEVTVPANTAIRYIALGGGATPQYTEVSLEQDIELATRAFKGPGRVLFAGGSDGASVRILGPETLRESLLSRLGELFDPRGDRDSRYRHTVLSAEAATRDNFEASLGSALRSGSDPLFVFIASHGVQGEQPRDNHIELWGGEPLDAIQLDALEGDATRPLRFVIASCYSGGFAELAFTHADPEQGPSRAPRCGLFAGTWDRLTSGCDPNPDRRAQEGYSLQMLHALRGEDRSGKALPIEQLDLDGDKRISLLEAHTRARIVSNSIDVPTSTSERFLRQVETRELKPNLKLLPEEAAVIRQLGARLHLTNRAAAQKRFKELSDRLDAMQDELDAADAELERAQGRLGALLLARWPVLNDAYHDEFQSTLKNNAEEIDRLLSDSREAKEYARTRQRSEELADQSSELEPDEAVVFRLVRAYETLALATSLQARGGPMLQHYQQLLSCERSIP